MTNDSVDNIRIDINRNNVRAAVYVRQGDTKTRTLHCTLVDAGQVVSMANVIVAEILIRKPDGNECDQGVVISGDELQYTWRTQDINVEGESKCQFMVTYDDGSVITSPEFSLYSYRKVLNQRVQQSLNEYTALSMQVKYAKEYADNAQSSASKSAGYADVSERNMEAFSEKVNNSMEELATLEESSAGNATRAETAASQAEECKKAVTASQEEMESSISQAKADIRNITDESADYAKQAKKSAEASAISASESGTMADRAATYDATYQGYVAQSATNAKSSLDYSNISKDYKDEIIALRNEAKSSEENAKASEEASTLNRQQSQTLYDKCAEIYRNMGEEGLVLGETASSAYRGDRGAEAYAHSQVTRGNPHGTTYTDVGADEEGAAAGAYANATAYTDQKIAVLINGAPETLDTLKEIADAMGESQQVVEALNDAIGTKANANELDSHENNATIHVTANEHKAINKISTLESDVADNATDISQIKKVISDHGLAMCSTARNVAAKEATLSGFVLSVGAKISVRFTDTGTANPTSGNITLNVNGTGAKQIVDSKTNKTVQTYANGGNYYNNLVQEYVYDGTYWVWTNRDNNTTYTNASLGQGYGTCVTDEETIEKAVTMSGYARTTGGMVAVRFTYAVPASSTMNINAKGAKAIYYQNAAIKGEVIQAGDTCLFVFDGSYYRLLAIDRTISEMDKVGYPG